MFNFDNTLTKKEIYQGVGLGTYYLYRFPIFIFSAALLIPSLLNDEPSFELKYVVSLVIKITLIATVVYLFLFFMFKRPFKVGNVAHYSVSHKEINILNSKGDTQLFLFSELESRVTKDFIILLWKKSGFMVISKKMLDIDQISFFEKMIEKK